MVLKKLCYKIVTILVSPEWTRDLQDWLVVTCPESHMSSLSCDQDACFKESLNRDKCMTRQYCHDPEHGLSFFSCLPLFTEHSFGLPLPFQPCYWLVTSDLALILGLLTLTGYHMPRLHMYWWSHSRLILIVPRHLGTSRLPSWLVPKGISVPSPRSTRIYARTPSGRAAGLYKPCKPGRVGLKPDLVVQSWRLVLIPVSSLVGRFPQTPSSFLRAILSTTCLRAIPLSTETLPLASLRRRVHCYLEA